MGRLHADGKKVPPEVDDIYATTVPDSACIQPMMDATYRLSPRAAARLEHEPPKRCLDSTVAGHTTNQLIMIDARSLRLSWASPLPVHQRGLYGCRLLVDEEVAAVGLCSIHETLDKCEMMAFSLVSSKTGKAHLMTEEEQRKLFPQGKPLKLVLVVKTSEFSHVADGPWLHDHIQRNMAVLHSWGNSKPLPQALKANLQNLKRSAL